ncbi:MAG: ArnT family glycosyltransferase [Chitinophagaceae bacterium]
MDRTHTKKLYLVIIFFIAIALLHILMASFSGLWYDEAYYSFFSENISWGYFDHPPMIAWMIGIGRFLFNYEFGVRLMSIIMSMGTLLVLYKILKPQNKGLFFILFLSIIPFQLLGYLAVPDIPLLFWTTIYLWIYKKFLDNNYWWQAIILGICMTLCMYSKYHALLIFLIIPLSNFSLLKNIKFYVANFIGILFFMPHLLWQYQHHFETLRFHLISRGSHEYKFFYTTDYIGGQIGIWGPLISWIVFWAFWKYTAQNKFERSLKFIFVGVLAFFLLSTYRGFVEANWTLVAFFPCFYITYKFVENKKRLINWIYILFPIVLALSFFARSILIFDYFPRGIFYQDDFYDNPNYAKSLANVAQQNPILFLNNYQYASQYHFYSQGKPTSSYGWRMTQFDMWRLDKQWVGIFDSVWITQKDNPFDNYKTDTIIDTRKGKFYMTKISITELQDSSFIKKHFNIDYQGRNF